MSRVIEEIQNNNLTNAQFEQFVERSEPLIIRGFCSGWQQTAEWFSNGSTKRLAELAGDSIVNVSVSQSERDNNATFEGNILKHEMLSVPFREFLNLFDSVSLDDDDDDDDNSSTTNNKRKSSDDNDNETKKSFYYLAQNPIWHENSEEIVLAPLKQCIETPSLLVERGLKNINLWMCCNQTMVTKCQ
jgi:hypothetical protein